MLVSDPFPTLHSIPSQVPRHRPGDLTFLQKQQLQLDLAELPADDDWSGLTRKQLGRLYTAPVALNLARQELSDGLRSAAHLAAVEGGWKLQGRREGGRRKGGRGAWKATGGCRGEHSQAGTFGTSIRKRRSMQTGQFMLSHYRKSD